MKKVLKVLLILFLLGIVSILIAVSLLILNYRNWKSDFEMDLNPEYLSKNYEEIPMDLQARFFEFIASQEKNDFIEISVSEFSDLLYFVSSQQNIEGLEVEKIYIEPTVGVWRIYADFNVGNWDVPWISFNLVKDNRETAELYVKNLYIGNWDVTKVLPEDFVNKINDGISDALIQFNENLFSKRYIQNIELLEENAIIKGVLY